MVASETPVASKRAQGRGFAWRLACHLWQWLVFTPAKRQSLQIDLLTKCNLSSFLQKKEKKKWSAQTPRMANEREVIYDTACLNTKSPPEDDNGGPTSKWHCYDSWQFIKRRRKKKGGTNPRFFRKGEKRKKTTGPTFHQRKKKQQKRGGFKLKFRSSNRGPAYPVFREAAGRGGGLNRSTLAE